MAVAENISVCIVRVGRCPSINKINDGNLPLQSSKQFFLVFSMFMYLTDLFTTLVWIGSRDQDRSGGILASCGGR